MSATKNDNAKEVLVFFLKLIAIWLSWKVIFYITGEEKIPLHERPLPTLSAYWEDLNDAMRYVVLQGAEFILHIFGYATQNNGRTLRILGERGMILGNWCLGFQFIYFFSMLAVISELHWRKKIFAVLTIAPIVTVLNMLRIAFLCIVVTKIPVALPIIHHYIFNAIVFGVLFIYYLFLLQSSKEK